MLDVDAAYDGRIERYKVGCVVPNEDCVVLLFVAFLAIKAQSVG